MLVRDSLRKHFQITFLFTSYSVPITFLTSDGKPFTQDPAIEQNIQLECSFRENTVATARATYDAHSKQYGCELLHTGRNDIEVRIYLNPQ